MQTHLTLRSLNGNASPDKDVQVLFAVNPDRKAILFIHGYSGGGVRTWSDFHRLLPGSPKCSQRDIYFYGYDGLRAEMIASAAIFRDFLDRVFERPGRLFDANLPKDAQRQPNFSYDEITIVAHSLGAVIARRAVIDATKSNLGWANKIKLILYAPAHKGASVAELALEGASSFSFLKLFAVGARFQSPLIDQLKPNSAPLKQLLDDTEAATQNGANSHLIAAKVVIATYERVVSNDRFGNDQMPTAIPNTTHTSVCKPTTAFLQPLALLEACL
jgi:pimeloyl-ACP methyl ester carboxylesterase